MSGRLPLIPTILVLLAVGVMLRLGLWQLDRMHEKEALLARFEAAAAMKDAVPLPATERERLAMVYAPVTAVCERITGRSQIGGRDAVGNSGWVQIAQCRDPAGHPFDAAIGVATDPEPRAWAGGALRGRIANAGPGRTRIIADTAPAGMRAPAPPDPDDIPNNHFSYAVQWFLFAGVALVIYVLALRKRLAGQGAAR